MNAVTLVDAHVHVYAEFDPGRLLDAASANFGRVARDIGATRWDACLLLTETAHDHWFDRALETRAGDLARGWRREGGETAEPAFVAVNAADESRRLVVVAGRQIVTAERLELHALGTRARFPDGLPAKEALARIHEAGALAALPWGVGKWTGARRAIARALLATQDAGRLLPADNGGRPWFWREPLLATGRGPVLHGSDPLPIPGEEERVGTAGCWFRRRGGEAPGVAGLIALLRDAPREEIRAFGPRETLMRFARNQLALRLRRR